MCPQASSSPRAWATKPESLARPGKFQEFAKGVSAIFACAGGRNPRRFLPGADEGILTLPHSSRCSTSNPRLADQIQFWLGKAQAVSPAELSIQRKPLIATTV